MPKLDIQVWNYKLYTRPGETRDDTQVIFETTLDDQELVSSLYEQFNKLERGIVARHGVVAGHRYLFRFFWYGGNVQVYQGIGHFAEWLYADQTHQMTVAGPNDILESLHKSMGLPWALPPVHH